MRCRLALVFVLACGNGAPPARTAPRVSERAFESALAPYGRWEEDTTFGARWCPREPPQGEARFEPFRNYGHWEHGPRWATARPGTWLETTTTKGAWLLREATDEWCWIPGHEPPRLAWKTGARFVGWAPLAPGARVDEIPESAFTYTFAGMLFEPWLTVLTGEARADAAALARPSAPPSPTEVAVAREELLARAREAGDNATSELPAAQTLWVILTGRPTKPVVVAKPSVPIGPAAPPAPKLPSPGGLPQLPDGMGDLGALQGLLGGLGGGVDLSSLMNSDGGIPPGLLPEGVRPPPKK